MKALRKNGFFREALGCCSSSASRHGGQLVDEVIDGVHHELDVILVGHAVLPVAPEDDVDVVAQHALGDLQGDVPGHVFVLQAVDEAHGARDGDGALQQAVVLCFLQQVHANSVHTFLVAFGRDRPRALILELLPCLMHGERKKRGVNADMEKSGSDFRLSISTHFFLHLQSV